MKTRITTLLAFLVCSSLALAADWPAEYSRLLGKYVTPAGVKYSEWKADADDMKAIQAVVDGIAAAPASGAKSREQLAFHINAYNAWILREALAKYPTKSVKDTLFTFFTGNRIVVAGEKMSFNKLEKEIIRPKFNEPRVHFVVNCASIGCPMLREEAYVAVRLEKQLEDQERRFLSDRSRNRYDVATGKLTVSRIFDWYKEDWASGFKGIASREQYFARHAGLLTDDPSQRRRIVSQQVGLAFTEYDWSLNDADK